MYYVYVLISKKDGRFYTGYTNNLKQRFLSHQEGLVRATSSRRPFKLFYYEAYTNGQDAQRREKYLKSGMGKRDLKKRLKEGLEWEGLTG